MGKAGSRAERTDSAALILTPEHRVLLWRDPAGAWRLPRIPCAADEATPGHVVAAAVRARTGLELPAPAGSRAPDGGPGPREFVYLVGKDAAAGDVADARFVPFAGAIAACKPSGDDEALWSLYVDRMLAGWAPPTRELDVFAFGNSPWMAANLVHLVIAGAKRVTFGWLRAAETEQTTIPWPGLVSVVTDGFGYPRCVIETVEVTRPRFSEVSPALASDEGEGDLSHADWREGHAAYFQGEATRLGLTWNEDEVLIAERFRVLHVVGRV